MMDYYGYMRDKAQYRGCLRRLMDMHILYRNFVEAANCALQQATLYHWHSSDSDLTKSSDKENCIKMARNLFDQGKYWERCLDLSAELREHWKKQAKVHIQSPETSAKIFAKINGSKPLEERYARCIKTQERIFEQYFFVEFSGECDAFGKYVQNKKFVVRGDEAERVLPFVDRLQSRFPKATIIHTNNTTPGQCIYVRACDPVKPCESFCAEHDIPYIAPVTSCTFPQSKQYYEISNSNIFLYSRPFIRGDASENDQFRKLWICNLYLVTKCPFPSITRWAEVVTVVEVEKCPVENARDAVEAKNTDLQTIIEKVRNNANAQNTSALSMTLSGVVDAVVAGGIKHYMDAFLTREYILANSQHEHTIMRLIDGLRQQRNILSVGLAVHKQVVSDKMASFHEKLETCYDNWSTDINKVCAEAEHVLSTRGSPDLVKHVSSGVRHADTISGILAQLDAGKSLDTAIQESKPEATALERLLEGTAAAATAATATATTATATAATADSDAVVLHQPSLQRQCLILMEDLKAKEGSLPPAAPPSPPDTPSLSPESAADAAQPLRAHRHGEHTPKTRPRSASHGERPRHLPRALRIDVDAATPPASSANAKTFGNRDALQQEVQQWRARRKVLAQDVARLEERTASFEEQRTQLHTNYEQLHAERNSLKEELTHLYKQFLAERDALQQQIPQGTATPPQPISVVTEEGRAGTPEKNLRRARSEEHRRKLALEITVPPKEDVKLVLEDDMTVIMSTPTPTPTPAPTPPPPPTPATVLHAVTRRQGQTSPVIAPPSPDLKNCRSCSTGVVTRKKSTSSPTPCTVVPGTAVTPTPTPPSLVAVATANSCLVSVPVPSPKASPKAGKPRALHSQKTS
eukprot:TRINITY_DN589_c0_g2_i1.p1 TRINITY_DN589_c0_g2~~TRINITY_DN589_c0_g2_i1.p1  ORF type:complete len:1014 (-),score=247.83 TRINITY_DN589_c0_g2_i1:45-2645(-)